MVTPPAAVLYGIATLAGGILCLLGLYCYRQWDEPGVAAFTAFTLLVGIGAIGGGLVALVVRGPIMNVSFTPGLIGYLFWALGTVPWAVFAFQYTGKYTRIRARTVGLVAVPVVGLVSYILVLEAGLSELSLLIEILSTFAFIHVFFLLVIGIYLLVRTTHEFGHLSLVQGISLATAGFAPFALGVAGPVADELGEVAAAGIYATVFVTSAGLLTVAVYGYDMFESTPASGTIGEQAIARETDNLIFVVDQHDRVIKHNPKAANVFGLGEVEQLGEPLCDILDVSREELAEMETYETRTGVERRRFDPEVSSFTDQHGRTLGYIVSLHDVTERELRKQRLEVLNRVLRHNLRNSVDVIKSNAEIIAENGHDDRTTAIIDSADGLANLGYKARSIDRFVSRQLQTTERDLRTVTEEIITSRCESSDRSIGVDLDGPPTAPLSTDWEALTAALDSAVGNAIEHASALVRVELTEYATGYRIVVIDDGPGVPDSELAAIDAGRETPLQHGTGLGLWQIKWGIQKLNGTVAFDNENGTRVRMTVPDRSVEQAGTGD